MLSKIYTFVGLPADPLMSMMASYLRSRKQKNKEDCSLAEKTPPESSSNSETNPASTFEISEYFKHYVLHFHLNYNYHGV